MDWHNLQYLLVVILLYNAGETCAQETTTETCSTSGAIAASVIITFLVTAAVIIGTYWWYKRRKQRQGKHLIFETDPEKGNDEYAFDNPGFKDAGLTPMSKSIEKVNKLETPKNKWNQWSPLSALTSKNEKKKIQDDAALDDEIVKVVSLRSHDFTGLGFNVNGNMRDGIYIKDVLQKGPASASGKLNPGDRISSVTISFEHMVYEDALSILSYASPYEITIEARSIKNGQQISGQSAQPGHPLYKSFSTADLLKIEKSSKKRLFQPDDYPESLGSNYSSLQKSRSNLTTLERKEELNKNQSLKSQLNTEQLKAQLERKISEDHDENLRIKNEKAMEKPVRQEIELQRSENKLQKFGIKVLPEPNEQRSPKAAELSQNDNNINLERHAEKLQSEQGIDEPDLTKIPPEIKKREKTVKTTSNETLSAITAEKPDTFVRQNSLTGSGIKRDKNGIPQEIPSHMLNAAVAARRNRKGEDKSEKEIDIKSPKKLKGKAPAPPPEFKINDVHESVAHSVDLDLDQIQPADEIDNKQTPIPDTKPPTVNGISVDEEPVIIANAEVSNKNYNSDSDGEVDNNSSVNTIELNASDITIHQTEENDEKLNRKTASTGDLTRIHKGRKTSSGTLERAQSLDITDTGIPPLNKKRKGSNVEFDSKTSSDDSLYGKVLLNKEPRLSLILDGLNTFQRSRLKKSTEWGNLEDAILNLSKDDDSYKSLGDTSDKSPEFDALVNKINEIKSETSNDDKPIEKELEDNVEIKIKDVDVDLEKTVDESEVIDESPIKEVKVEIREKVKNQIWPTFVIDKTDEESKIKMNGNVNVSNVTNDINERDEVSHEDVLALEEQIRIAEMNLRKNMGHFLEDKANGNHEKHKEDVPVQIAEINGQTTVTLDDNVNNASSLLNREDQVRITEINIQTDNLSLSPNDNGINQIQTNDVTFNANALEEVEAITSSNLNTDFILAEKSANDVLFNLRNDDTNVSDDMKVSRHSLDRLNHVTNPSNNISQVTVNERNNYESPNTFNVDLNVKKSALPKPSVNVTKLEPSKPKPKNQTRQDKDYNGFGYNKLVTTPDLIKNVSLAEAIHNLNNEVTIEGPSSLTLEINENVNTVRNTPLGLHCEKMSNGSSRVNDRDEVDLNKNRPQNLSKSVSNLTYITEIQVLTPNKTAKSNPNISEIEIVPSDNKTIHNLDTEFEKYVKNFETNIRTFETNIKNFDSTLQEVIKGEKITNNNVKKPEKTMDPEKELHKIQEIAEEQLKKLPEMRFTTSSYESKPQEKRHSHIEQLRSNFEKNDKTPTKNLKMDIGATKSRIPIPASIKTPPTSPERRDSKNLDTESQKEILEMMSSPTVTSTFKYQPKSNNKNITVTSIRTNSKIPSGLPTYVNRPPVPPRKTETTDNETIIQVSSNGSNENSFKQWVFNPNDNAITNITVSENKDTKS